MRFPALPLVALLAACATAPAPSATSSAPAASAVTGTYALVELDGKPVTPETEGEPGWVIDRGTVTLADGGHAVLEVAAHRRADGQARTHTIQGTYAVDGTALRLSLNVAPNAPPMEVSGTVGDGRLAFSDPMGRPH
ncbi:MAG TPA: hypothetical protein VFQ39_15150, partial [Longimicrobium sp.]|nr:hypothetical protein [Longimicrobium sp.]